MSEVALEKAEELLEKALEGGGDVLPTIKVAIEDRVYFFFEVPTECSWCGNCGAKVPVIGKVRVMLVCGGCGAGPSLGTCSRNHLYGRCIECDQNGKAL